MRQNCLMLIFLCCTSVAQAQKAKNGAWYIPSGVPRINGLAIGLNTECSDGHTLKRQVINGIDLELVGSRILPPIFMPMELWEVYEDGHIKPYWQVNGLGISTFGMGGLEMGINGINISGLNALTSRTNGLAVAALSSVNQRLNGVSISFFNGAIITRGVQLGVVNGSAQMSGLQIGATNGTTKMRGVQIGLFNNADNLKGLQIGLWNRNGKRSLPLLNFQF